MAPSATFLALQGLARQRKSAPPAAPNGPAVALSAREGVEGESRNRGRGDDDYVEKQMLMGREIDTDDDDEENDDDEESDDDSPALTHLQTSPALAHLPSFQAVVLEYNLFRGDDGDRVDRDGTIDKCVPTINDQGHVKCACVSCKRWRDVVDGRQAFVCSTIKKQKQRMYEVFTKEHVARLAAYFRKRARRVSGDEGNTGGNTSGNTNRPLRVLELGAGNGLLRYSLTNAVAALDSREASAGGIAASGAPPKGHGFDSIGFPSVAFYATDVKPSVSFPDSVTTADAESAVRDSKVCGGFPPDVVLVCWHPMHFDWTQSVRAVPSVKEYVMVGETDFGICGAPWKTWGYFGDDGDGDGADDSHIPPTTPPYAEDGFTRHALPKMSSFQIGKTDEPWRKLRGTKTVSFRRRRG